MLRLRSVGRRHSSSGTRSDERRDVMEDKKHGRRRVRSERRTPPDLRKLAKALIALAQAQAEAEAQADHEQQRRSSRRRAS